MLLFDIIGISLIEQFSERRYSISSANTYLSLFICYPY